MNALSESEDRNNSILWRDAVNAMDDVVFIIDEDSAVLDCNAAAEKFLNAEKSAIIGRKCHDLVHHCDHNVPDCPFQRMKKSLKRETLVMSENGAFFEVVVDPISEQDGCSQKAIHVLKDITDRKKQEDSLAFFRKLLDNSRDSIFIADTETGKIIDSNEKAHVDLGYTKEELLGINAIDLDKIFPGKDAWARHIEELRKVNNIVIEGCHVRKDGTSFAVEVNTGIVSTGGKETVVAIARNIEARKQMDQKIRFLSLVAQNVHDSIIVANTAFKITYTNPATIALFGYTEDELLDRDLDMLCAEPFPDHVCGEMRDVVSKGDPFERILLFKKKDESSFHNEMRVSPMRDESGEITAFVCVNRDITELIEAEKMARQMESHEKDALIGRIAGKAAHDFNNILGIIMGTSQLLLMEELPGNLKHEIEIIKDSASHGREITRNLVFFAKDQEPKVSHFDVNEKIRNILQALKSELEPIEVKTVFENDREYLLGDPSLIQNAALNLIKNSIDAVSLSTRGEILVKTFSDSECVHIEVTDNGCGIPPEYHKNIFDPAFTLKGGADYTCSYRAGIRGSGYGLSNVKKCVDKHRGKIEFRSDIGKGSIFRISIPIVRESLDASKIKALDKLNIVQNKRVLIVEDEPHLARVLAAVLEKFNHSIDHAIDGRTALELIANNDYDVVSLDFLLPDMDGMDVYKKIRSRSKDVPVVFVSGNFEFMKSISELKERDANVGHLSKPFDNVDYLKKINKWLSGKN